MLLRRTFPFPGAGGGGGGPLAFVLIPSDPVEKYNPQPSGSSTQNVSAVVTGGTGVYSILWTYVSGATSILNSSPTSNPCTFSALGNGDPVNAQEAIWNCEVTDVSTETVNQDFTIRFLFGLEPP